MSWHSRRTLKHVLLGVILCTAGAELATPAFAEQPKEAAQPSIHISAQVDKTTVEAGVPVTLTITIEGAELSHAKFQPFELPKPLRVVGQSQVSKTVVQGGQSKQAVSLVYGIVGLEAGTFQLGPFQVLYEGKPALTEPIEFVVKKPVLPPQSVRAPRYNL